uniref:Uncharacterized protein n=1 Tax=Arundo donax TaxID=35708 RepID=A0A0A8YV59_ARUDO
MKPGILPFDFCTASDIWDIFFSNIFMN